MVVENKSKNNNLNKSFQAFADNRFFILSSVLLLVGILIGTISVGHYSSQSSDILISSFKSFITHRKNTNFVEILFSSFFSEFCIITICLFSSFGVIGIPVIPLMLLFKGFTSGVLSGILYRFYSLQGIAFSNLILLPSEIFAYFSLIYLSSKCFKLSLKFLSLLRDVSSKGIVVRPDCVSTSKKYLLCVIIVFVSSIVEALLTIGFIRFFNLG